MKKILLSLSLVLLSVIGSCQYTIPASLINTAQEIRADVIRNLTIVIDKTSVKDKEDVAIIMNYVNNTYIQADIHFKLDTIVSVDYDLNKTTDILKSIRKLRKLNDITIYVTGKHSGDNIGVELGNVIMVDLKGDNESASGLMSHELGHVFDLKHVDNHDHVMSTTHNSDYSGTFSKSNLNILRRRN
jgi:hypothetical protein